MVVAARGEGPKRWRLAGRDGGVAAQREGRRRGGGAPGLATEQEEDDECRVGRHYAMGSLEREIGRWHPCLMMAVQGAISLWVTAHVVPN
ncbi:hypothetical protein TIFTF001_053486 [Ficus carica]|uniref:Uncharacterized protein n=1 Tax=Ficus carica TaxID=3494 RepID=A0AA88EC34_FICCA|nr:hypothetical protein TIFTF001_053486 [Ficus carica]